MIADSKDIVVPHRECFILFYSISF